MVLKIGSVVLNSPVILAPMSGVTDLPFRSIVRELGAGLLVSEMIASRAMIMQTRQSMQKAEIDDDTSVQLAGCEPEVMAEAAKLNEDMGAKIIDINFGCPVKKVVNGHAGSALMKDEKKAADILSSVVNAVKIPVTLKMRTGWDFENRNAPTLAKIAEDVGIQMITVHGRTRSQMYNGNSDWEFIKGVKETVKIPVIVNGDIKNMDNIRDALSASKADGVMIGRGAYGKPWIISQAMHFMGKGDIIDDPTPQEKLRIILKHFNGIIDYYGEDVGVKISRKHIAWYSAGINGAAEFRAKVNLVLSAKVMLEYINEFFSKEKLVVDHRGQPVDNMSRFS